MKKALLICLVVVSLLAGCSENRHSLTTLQGKQCFVVYRRDALGYATDKNSGVKAETVFSGGTGELAARGVLKDASDAWVVLETREGLQAIPVRAVLAVREIK